MKGKNIQLFLGEDELNGVKIACISTSDLQATLIPRKLLSSTLKSLPELKHPGFYLLFDDVKKIYVGESECLSNRLEQHAKTKEWWTTAIVVTMNNVNSPLTKADIKYLELMIYNGIKKAGRFETDQIVPAKASVSRFREVDLETLYSYTHLLLSEFGYPAFDNIQKSKKKKVILEDEIKEEKKFKKNFFSKIFDFIKDKFKKKTNIIEDELIKNDDNEISNKENIKSDKNIFTLEKTLKRGYVNAKGFYVDGIFILKKGSQIIKKSAKSFKYNYNNMIKDGKIKEEENNYILLEDIIFKSPSGASSFAMNRNSNGWFDWKNTNNVSLNDLYREQKIS